MSKIKTYKNRHGRVFRAPQHEVFDRCGGIYQVTSLRYLRDLVPHARRIVDVGAHVGVMTMEYATWARRVDAFECENNTFRCLEHNIAHNQTLPPGQPWYQTASTEITAKITLHREGVMDRASQAYVTNRAQGLASFVSQDSSQQPCSTVTIDSFGWRDVDIIKADTEGTEWLIVQGARRTIERCRPVVQVEMWRWERRFGLDNQDMLDYFRSLGYRQTNSAGQDLPWDYAGRWDKPRAKAAGHRHSAMDRFFIPL